MHLDHYLEVLRLLADPEAQLRYERDVPIANVPAELVCMWFDDLNAAEPSPDLAPSDASRIRVFSSFYASHVEGLPTDRGVVALQATAAWQQISAEARATLSSLEGGASNEPMQADGPSGRR